MTENTAVRLRSRPTGMVGDENFELRREPAGTPAEGELLVRVRYCSLDPAMRGWLNEGKSYIPPVQIGEVMRAGAVGEVLEPNAQGFAAGDWVLGPMGIQTHAVVKAAEVTRIDTSIAPPERFLGVLGMPGMTAYFGLLDVGALKEGESVLVSAASGAVGALAAQVAKLKGCHAVGIAGGAEKCAYLLDELGLDGAIDYKSENVAKAVAEHFPRGVDVYFDNVGGDILEAAMSRLAMRARIVLCGAISQYNDFSKVRGPRNYMNLLVQRARMEGFVVFDYRDRYGEAVRDIAGWLAEGKVKAKEDVQQGIERFPELMNMLFTGENFGKLVLKV